MYRQIGRCTGNDCHRVIVFGLRMLRTGRGHRHRSTRDWIVPPMSVEMGRHRNGEPANVLEDDDEGTTGTTTTSATPSDTGDDVCAPAREPAGSDTNGA